MTITKPAEPDQGQAITPAVETVLDTGKKGMASVAPTYEIDPRTGWTVLASTMEKRRARARALNTPRQQARRAKIKTEREAEAAPTLAALDSLEMLPTPKVDRQILLTEARAFRQWLDLNGPKQRQYRPQKVAYWKSRMLLLNARLELDGDPTPAEFAARLTRALNIPFDRMQARNRLHQLLKLEGPEGPWFPGAGSA